jgi:hypothetical protein
METNYSKKSQTKLNEIELEPLIFLSNLRDEENEDEELEIIEEDIDSEIISDQPVEMDYLLNIQSQIDLVKENKKPKSDSTHPMDDYFRKLILDVMVKEFLPILEAKLKTNNNYGKN